MSSNRFKACLAQPPAQPLLGSWVMSAAPAVAEAMGVCGFDFLVVDMEHSPIDIAEAVSMLRAIAGTPAEPVVRLAWNDQVMVKRVLDGGARNLMFPFIQSAAEAREAVSYTRYPPHGVRGVAGVHRASRYGRAGDYFTTANDEIAVVIQLETPEAIERLAEIAAVPGVDALFVGPGDLSAALGRIGEVGHPEVQALIAKAAQMAHTVGKSIGIVGGNPDMVGRFLSYGYDWAAVASDVGMMTGRAVEWAAAIRARNAAFAAAGASAAPTAPSAAPAY
ncbi:MAG: 2-dehydro-3-deoxyglucarate aldolase [Gammaproteobacteria bacterium]|jgi:4-hydroxy-2-oxoheptanedioate aldolase|nr:2-dehydro-3-deoxyglucarate aldolase [Gammaproteobacteria bacterium]